MKIFEVPGLKCFGYTSRRFVRYYFIGFLLIGYWGSAQVTFEPGYFIDNNGNIIDGYVANEQWGRNPDGFLFRTALESAAVSYGLEDVREFGIGDSYKYERHKVRLEVSSDLSGDLKFDRNLDYKVREVFLRVVVDGEIRLLSYSSTNNDRYFVQENLSSEIVLLRYKRYRTDAGSVGFNTQFRHQLAEMFRCEGAKMPNANRLDYKESDLVRFILTYADCNGVSVSGKPTKSKDSQVKISARFGLSTGALALEQNISFESPAVNQVRADFGTTSYPRIGLEFEVILPSRGNRWSIFADPSFQKATFATSFTREYPALSVVIQSNAKYTSLELPLGVRHYFYWSTNKGWFLDLALSMRFNLDSRIDFMANQALGRPEDLEILATQGYFSLGLGLKVNRRIALEGRIQNGFNLLGDNPEWNAPFAPGGSLILGVAL